MLKSINVSLKEVNEFGGLRIRMRVIIFFKIDRPDFPHVFNIVTRIGRQVPLNAKGNRGRSWFGFKPFESVFTSHKKLRAPSLDRFVACSSEFVFLFIVNEFNKMTRVQ